MPNMIRSDKAPEPVGPYSQAVQAGNFLFTSGQIGIDPATGRLVEGGIREQARQVMENLWAILETAGSDFSRVIKATAFLGDISDFAVFNEVYGKYFPKHRPARSAFQVAALPLGAKVEVEMVALVAE
jgi:2-iminobutanoate/2-iminopropanoate deaminase